MTSQFPKPATGERPSYACYGADSEGATCEQGEHNARCASESSTAIGPSRIPSNDVDTLDGAAAKVHD